MGLFSPSEYFSFSCSSSGLFDAMAEGHDACGSQPGALPSSSSPLPSACYSSFQTWLPAGSRLWTSPSSVPLLPLRGDAVTAASGPRADVVKQGYLGKMERTQKRYFVLKAGSHTGPSRLEWYKNQEKFLAPEKPAGKAALLGSSKQGSVCVTFSYTCVSKTSLHL